MNVEILSVSDSNLINHKVPLFSTSVSAGFPSPAQDHVEKTLDLNELCIKNPSATFFVRVEGESMIEAGIYHDDILVVDRSLKPAHGDIVIAQVYGDMTVKQIELAPVRRLVPRNSLYPVIDDLEQKDVSIFGVVTNIVRALRRQNDVRTC